MATFFWPKGVLAEHREVPLYGDCMTRILSVLRPIALELTAVNETVLMENLRVFEMNGFRFLIQSDGE